MTTAPATVDDLKAEVARLAKALTRCQNLVLRLARLEERARAMKDQQRGVASLLAGREAHVYGQARQRLLAALDGSTAAALIDMSAYSVDSDSNELVCNACGERRPKSAQGLMQLRQHTHKEA